MAGMDKRDWFALFNNFDKNQDGVIACCELKRLLNYLGFNPTEIEMKDYMNQLDKNHDQTIDFEEFYEFSKTLKDPIGEIRQAFTTFDTNKDGYIDEKELKDMFTSGNFDPNEIDGLFKLVDVNGDGKIDYEGSNTMPWYKKRMFLALYKKPYGYKPIQKVKKASPVKEHTCFTRTRPFHSLTEYRKHNF